MAFCATRQANRGRLGRPRKKIRELVDLAQRRPPEGETHWTVRALAKKVGIGASTAHGILAEHRLVPHKVQPFKVSTDPEFTKKTYGVKGLYMSPPDRAVVLLIDEKTQIQALGRMQKGLPMKPGWPATMTHEDKRNGTTTLFAAKHSGRDGHRPPHRPPPASGVHRVPRADREGGARRTGDPCHPGQRIRPQALDRHEMAGGAPALDLPLHADLRLLDERGRGLNRAAQRGGGETVQMDGQPGSARRRLPKRVSNDSNEPLGVNRSTIQRAIGTAR